MRRPLRSDSFDLFWSWSLSHPVRALDRVLNAEIELRQHIAAAEAEHEEHLRRPSADALHLDEMLDQVIVSHRLDGVEWQRARLDLR